MAFCFGKRGKNFEKLNQTKLFCSGAYRSQKNQKHRVNNLTQFSFHLISATTETFRKYPIFTILKLGTFFVPSLQTLKQGPVPTLRTSHSNINSLWTAHFFKNVL
uniref:Uncharacterized protein n=1 Tax=Cacopsylla melanoneura TaxID=428564 RepID=A0A8D8VN69_9HEMI